MRFQELRPAYEKQGYVVVKRFLNSEEFLELSRNLDRYIGEVVPTLSEKHAFFVDRSRPETLKQMQHMSVDPYFDAYAKHPKWLELAEDLAGEPVSCDAPEWFNKPPGTISPTPPHQDNYYFCLKPNNVLTIWLALDVVDRENGCLRYVPGSHLRGVRPHQRSNILGFSQGISDYGDQDFAEEVEIHLQPGDAVVHHGETIHRAEANVSPIRNRRAFAMVCRGESCRRDEEAFTRYQSALKLQHEQMGIK